MSELNRRNTQTFFDQMKELDRRLREHEVTIRQMVGAIGDLEGRLRQAEAALAAYRITNLGAGPTVRE